MSLFSSIRLAGNTLRADQIAMQVIGQNIANANTPGYIREEVILAPGPTQRLGSLLLGSGVEVEAVVQKIDKFLEERLRGAVSDRFGLQAQQEVFVELEQLIGELEETDLSTLMNNFFGAIAEVLNQPESLSLRNLAVLEGKTLTTNISRLASRAHEIRSNLNLRTERVAGEINRLVEDIRVLNIRITETEGGGVSGSDAVGLRDQRLVALEELAKLVKIRAQEQENGTVTVYAGGDYLVFDGVARQVEVVLNTDDALTAAEVHMKETDAPLDSTAGQYHGLTEGRDTILSGFLGVLDDLARTLVFEFNKIHSAGQGLTGYQEMASEAMVDAIDRPLDEVGLEFTPVNGSFQVLVHSTKTGLTQTTDVMVDLNGLGDDMTLDDLVAQLDAVDGISAAAASENRLSITSDSPDLEFGFAADTSGLLAALGLNTFFTGTSALSLDVHEVVLDDPGKLAASRGGIAVDTENAVELAAFLDLPIESHNGTSLADLYDRMVGQVTEGSTVARTLTEAAQVFEDTLRGKKLATSGVSLDEEAIRLIGYQRSFQASARYIAALDELFEILVNI